MADTVFRLQGEITATGLLKGVAGAGGAPNSIVGAVPGRDYQAPGDYPTRAEAEAGWWSWAFSGGTEQGVAYSVEFEEPEPGTFIANLRANGAVVSYETLASFDVESITFTESLTSPITATRHRVSAPVPTKPEDIGAQPAGDYASTAALAAKLSRAEAEAGFTEWECEPADATVGWDTGQFDGWYIDYDSTTSSGGSSDPNATELTANFGSITVTATRTRLRPTPEMEAVWNAKQDALTPTQLANIAAVPGKAQADALGPGFVAGAQYQRGYLVEHGGRLYVFAESYSGGWDGAPVFTVTSVTIYNELNAALADITYAIVRPEITNGAATLQDHAGNVLGSSSSPISSALTLTLPAENTNHLRDFLATVHVAANVALTFAAPTGETIAYEAEGGAWPDTSAAGKYVFRFTETDAGVFLVQCGKAEAVTPPTIGGAS